MTTRPSLSVVIPVFNEEESIDELVRRCLLACEQTKDTFEIVLVDDGSSDLSAEKIDAATKRNPGKVVGVFLNRNYGQHAAVIAGFEQSKGDVIITLDADLQNPPEEIPRLVDAMDKGYDVVGTVRRQRQDTLFRKAASAIINKGVQKSTGVKMHDYGCMLRAYRRHIVEAMLMCEEHSTFIPILANSFARTTTEIQVTHDAREQGQSKYSLMKLVMLHFDLLTSMTTFPLRLLSILGGIISLAGIGFGSFLLLMRLYYGAEWAAQGVFTLFAILFIFVGAQFIAMGLLGEYIGRIYHDVRARPRYFVQQISGDSNINGNIDTKG
jgi:undecaprenyl-phosphate 4-deoxy-4-formamido-L-arabinose transferase